MRPPGEEQPPAHADFRSLKGVLNGVRVLLVEDEPATKRVTALILIEAGAEVTAVDSAPEALDAFRRSRPSILISDIGLPEMGGYALLSQIRALETDERTAPVPAVALTAYVQVKDRQRALAEGFQLHLAKPVDAADLIDSLMDLLQHGEQHLQE